MLLLAVHPGGSRSSAVAAVHPRLRLRPAAASAPHQHHPPAAAADTAATLADFGSCVVDARSWSSFEAGHAAAPCVVSIPGIADSGPTGSSADQFVAAVDRLFGLHAPPLLVMESAEEETGHRHPLADALAEAGYDVTAVDGGFKEWSATGHAVVSGSAYEISS